MEVIYFNNDPVEFKISNIVMGIVFNETFNIINLLELLPCVHIPNFQYKKSIPFFGIPNCIVSCQGEKEWRGIRVGKGNKNAICIDYQNEIKNIHIKITNNKFHMTGCKSYEMGIKTALSCMELLSKVDEIWKYFYSLDIHLRIHLCETSLDLLLDKNNPDKILMFDSPVVHEKFSKINISLYQYAHIILQIIAFSYDYPNLESFYNKINKILNLQPCQQSLFYNGTSMFSSPIFSTKIKKNIPVSIYSPIYNGVYNYKYPFKIFLPDMAKALFSLGYTVEYHNIAKSNKMEVAIPVCDEENDNFSFNLSSHCFECGNHFDFLKNNICNNCFEKLSLNENNLENNLKNSKKNKLTTTKYKKIKAYKFTINTNGSVQQTSPTSSLLAYQKFVELSNHIFLIINQENIDLNNKKELKTLKTNNDVETLNSIFSYYNENE